MISKIQIKNYQSHRHTTIALSAGITGIIGKSLSGKTAILRAVNWLVYNRPAGYSFHSHFAESIGTEVVLNIDDIKIARTGGKKKAYKLSTMKKPFQKFGRKVPDVISEKLNIEEINIQGQHDPPFLITSPPGRIAEAINKATNVEKINDGIREINRRNNRLKTEAEIVSNDIDKLAESIARLDPIEKVDSKIIELKKIHRKTNKLIIEQAELSGIIMGLQVAREQIVKLKKQVKLKNRIKKLEAIDEEILVLRREDDYIADVQIKRREFDLALDYHKRLCKKYIDKIKQAKKCPSCIGPINKAAIQRIKNEIRFDVRHPRDQ